MEAQRAQNVRVVAFHESTNDALAVSINAWLAAAKERRVLDTHFDTGSVGYSALIYYTD